LYCKHLSKPDGWDDNWYPAPDKWNEEIAIINNISWKKVYWGYVAALDNSDFEYLIINDKIDYAITITEVYNTLSIIIPDKITLFDNDFPVKVIEPDAFSRCYYLEAVVLPESITEIPYGLFQNLDRLKSVIIGDAVTSIGNDAFNSCTSLTSITIPDSVVSIGDGAFYYCESLTSVVIGDALTSIGKSAFYGCSSLTTVTFGENSQLTSIGSDAFSYCSSLTNITIPNSVTCIGSYAFSNCSNLTSVTLESTTPPTLGSSAFSYTHSTLKIYVPSESVDTYKSASGWSDYASKIYAMP